MTAFLTQKFSLFPNATAGPGSELGCKIPNRLRCSGEDECMQHRCLDRSGGWMSARAQMKFIAVIAAIASPNFLGVCWLQELADGAHIASRWRCGLFYQRNELGSHRWGSILSWSTRCCLVSTSMKWFTKFVIFSDFSVVLREQITNSSSTADPTT